MSTFVTAGLLCQPRPHNRRAKKIDQQLLNLVTHAGTKEPEGGNAHLRLYVADACWPDGA